MCTHRFSVIRENFPSTQHDTLGNIPKQRHETPGELSSNRFGEGEEFGSHLLIQGKTQGTASTQSIDVASESVMDYTNEFTRSEIYESKEALIQRTREFGKKNGFVIVVKRSDSGDAGQKGRITFVVREVDNTETKEKIKRIKKKKQLRNTSTKKCRCPFTLKGNKQGSGDNWMLKSNMWSA